MRTVSQHLDECFLLLDQLVLCGGGMLRPLLA